MNPRARQIAAHWAHIGIKFGYGATRRLTMNCPNPNCSYGIIVSSQKEHTLRSLPKSVVVLATLLLAVLAFSIGASSASAHGGHRHGVAVGDEGARGATLAPKDAMASDQAVPFNSLERATTDASELGASTSRGEKGTSTCCCDGIMCHNGVAAAVGVFGGPVLTGTRLKAETPSGHPRRWSSGPERPPRT